MLLVIGHHARERVVGYIDTAVTNHHRESGAVGPHQLALVAEIRGAVSEHARHREGKRHPDQIRTEFAEPGAGAIGHGADHRVGKGVEDLNHK